MAQLAPDVMVDGRYRLVSRVGSGGMAEVWAAHDTHLDRMIALKLLHAHYAQDETFKERFRREASSAAALQHPHVVSIYDRGETDNSYYIAMEYVPGRTLKDLIRDEAPIDAVRAIDITLQILSALRFAHRHGVVHRDVKPQNVLIDEEGNIKVADFGIARAGASDMTETGMVMGTAQYLSPEQAQGLEVGPESDLYSTGIVLYEMLCGHVPFDGDSPVAIAMRHVSEQPLPPSTANPGVPPDLDPIVLHALSKDPAQRYRDADEFIAALRQVRGTLTLAPGPSTQQLGLAGVGAAAGAGALAGAALAADGEDGESPTPEEEAEEARKRKRKRIMIAIGLVLLLLIGAAVAFALTRPEQKPVPNVVGQPLQAAIANLQNAGFEVETERVLSREPIDRVLRQSPQPNQKADEGSTVTLVVSAGPGERAVPDVSGLTEKSARKELNDAGFKVKSTKEFSDSVPSGRVIRTAPPAGEKADVGSTVTLVVSRGVQTTTVPDVVGEPRSAAISAIEAEGLEASVEERESSTTESGTVIEQSPSGGEQARLGSTVTIVVSTGPKRATVPDVVGDPRDAAASALNDVGFRVSVQEQTVSDESQDGIVLSQRPGAGATADVGSTVTIVVGRYESGPTNPTGPTGPTNPTGPTGPTNPPRDD
jgi:beta-lactam-binding protein with PASTA domain